MKKVCPKCKIEKEINEFSSRGGSKKHLAISICKVCKKIYDRKYRKENASFISFSNKEFYLKNKAVIAKKRKQYRENNYNLILEYEKKYRIKNKEKISKSKRKYYLKNRSYIIAKNMEYFRGNLRMKKYANSYSKNRSKIDILYKIRRNVSNAVYLELKHAKNRKSITQHLPYSIKELKQYLEQQFEPWMTWNNWGKYIRDNWNDNDQSTWTWQIDHIIPQSKLHYSSMQDDNFKKCWSLENLRPLSAKQNILKEDK